MSSFYHRNERSGQARTFGYTPLYYPNEVNHCPGCGGKSWYLGRSSAECSHCHTALPLAQSMQQSMRPIFVRGHDREQNWGDFAYA